MNVNGVVHIIALLNVYDVAIKPVMVSCVLVRLLC